MLAVDVTWRAGYPRSLYWSDPPGGCVSGRDGDGCEFCEAGVESSRVLFCLDTKPFELLRDSVRWIGVEGALNCLGELPVGAYTGSYGADLACGADLIAKQRSRGLSGRAPGYLWWWRVLCQLVCCSPPSVSKAPQPVCHLASPACLRRGGACVGFGRSATTTALTFVVQPGRR